jgi:hypothetical protein
MNAVNQVFTAAEWLQLLMLGGLVGAVGQGARVVVGLKKVWDEASAAGQSCHEYVVTSRLVLSLALGSIAGALAAALVGVDLSQVSLPQILALAAAGYAGADFIEGAMSRFVPKVSSGAKEATGAVK